MNQCLDQLNIRIKGRFMILARMSVYLGSPGLPARVGRYEIDPVYTIPCPASVHVKDAIFVEEEPFIFHLMRQVASVDVCHFLVCEI